MFCLVAQHGYQKNRFERLDSLLFAAFVQLVGLFEVVDAVVIQAAEFEVEKSSHFDLSESQIPKDY